MINKHKPKPLLSEKSGSVSILLMIVTNVLNLLNRSKVEWSISWWLFVFVFNYFLKKKWLRVWLTSKGNVMTKILSKMNFTKINFIFFTKLYNLNLVIDYFFRQLCGQYCFWIFLFYFLLMKNALLLTENSHKQLKCPLYN